MKKKLLILAFSFWLLVFGRQAVFAQQEMADYQYQYEKYRNIHETYVKARDTYLKYQTLTSQEEFVKASQDFLFSRVITLHTYLQVIKDILKEAVDIEPNQKQELTLALDGEITWLKENESQLQNLQNPVFNDLLEFSLRLENKANLYQKLAYQTLANIILGKMRSLSSETVAINFLLEDKIKNSSGKDTVLLSQWLQTVRDKTYQSQKNLEKAESYLVTLNRSASGKDVYSNYLKIQEELGKARTGFLDNLNFQREIFREVEK